MQTGKLMLGTLLVAGAGLFGTSTIYAEPLEPTVTNEPSARCGSQSKAPKGSPCVVANAKSLPRRIVTSRLLTWGGQPWLHLVSHTDATTHKAHQ